MSSSRIESSHSEKAKPVIEESSKLSAPSHEGGSTPLVDRILELKTIPLDESLHTDFLAKDAITKLLDAAKKRLCDSKYLQKNKKSQLVGSEFAKQLRDLINEDNPVILERIHPDVRHYFSEFYLSLTTFIYSHAVYWYASEGNHLIVDTFLNDFKKIQIKAGEPQQSTFNLLLISSALVGYRRFERTALAEALEKQLEGVPYFYFADESKHAAQLSRIKENIKALAFFGSTHFISRLLSDLKSFDAFSVSAREGYRRGGQYLTVRKIELAQEAFSAESAAAFINQSSRDEALKVHKLIHCLYRKTPIGCIIRSKRDALDLASITKSLIDLGVNCKELPGFNSVSDPPAEENLKDKMPPSKIPLVLTDKENFVRDLKIIHGHKATIEDAFDLLDAIDDSTLKINVLVDCLYPATITGAYMWEKSKAPVWLKRVMTMLKNLGVDWEKLPGYKNFFDWEYDAFKTIFADYAPISNAKVMNLNPPKNIPMTRKKDRVTPTMSSHQASIYIQQAPLESSELEDEEKLANIIHQMEQTPIIGSPFINFFNHGGQGEHIITLLFNAAKKIAASPEKIHNAFNRANNVSILNHIMQYAEYYRSPILQYAVHQARSAVSQQEFYHLVPEEYPSAPPLNRQDFAAQFSAMLAKEANTKSPAALHFTEFYLALITFIDSHAIYCYAFHGNEGKVNELLNAMKDEQAFLSERFRSIVNLLPLTSALIGYQLGKHNELGASLEKSVENTMTFYFVGENHFRRIQENIEMLAKLGLTKFLSPLLQPNSHASFFTAASKGYQLSGDLIESKKMSFLKIFFSHIKSTMVADWLLSLADKLEDNEVKISLLRDCLNPQTIVGKLMNKDVLDRRVIPSLNGLSMDNVKLSSNATLFNSTSSSVNENQTPVITSGLRNV